MEEKTMGSGTFNTTTYYQAAKVYQTQSQKSLFQKTNILDSFNPLKVTTRESCASKEHSDPTSIIIACDVTGSMGKIPENLLKGGLGKIMESLLSIKAISNPQVMFAAIGDTECDGAPLQVTQFESDNRIEAQLKDLYLEGGGGGNSVESYHAIWYFAAYKTKLDSLDKGKKGLLFTIGDEMLPTVLKGDHIRKFIDKNYKGTDILTSQLLDDVTKKYDVFHLVVQDTHTYTTVIGADKVNTCWKKYLEERAILVPNYTEISEKIISTIKSLCELNPTKSITMNDQGAQKTTSASSSSSSSSNFMPVNEMAKVGVFSNKSTNVSSDSSSVLNKDSDNVPHLFMCPIAKDVMKDPVVAEDGMTYDRAEITTWLQKNSTSPITGKIIGKLLLPNQSLKSEILQWQDNNKSSNLTKTNH
jgi:hypothetical protein